MTNTPGVNEILSDVSVLPNGDIRVVWAANDDVVPTDHNVYATTFTPIVPGQTTTALTSSLNSSVSGQDVTLTATVTAASGSATGSVTFNDGSSVLGTGTLGVGGVATLVTSSLTVGSHAITAAYSGDASHAASTSPVLTQTVNPASPVSIVVSETILVTDSPVVTPSVMLLVPETITVTDTPTVLPSVMLTVPETITVTDTPAITVQSPNVPPLAQDVSVATTAGQPIMVTLLASDPNSDPLTFAIVTGPTHGSLSAVSANQVAYTPALGYVGGDSFTFKANDGQADSDVATVSISIGVAPTTTVLTSSPNPSVGGQNVTLTATVGSPAGVPQGSVEFSYRIPTVLHSFVLGTAPIDASGVASLTTPDLFVGNIAVTAVYQGGGVFAASSASVSQLVTPVPTTTTLVSSGPTSLTTKPPVFTATLGAAGLGPATGEVEFFADGVSLGRSPVFTRSGNQVAVRGGATLTVGTHSITASYVGDSAHATSTSPALDQGVWEGTYFAVDLTPAFTDPTDATAINESNWVVGYSSPPTTTGFRFNGGFLYSGGALVGLGGLGGQSTVPIAINDAGQVVGQSTTASSEVHAFAYQAGQLTDLGTLGGSTSRALAVNNIGLIVGSADTASATHGFLYQGGTMTDLGALGDTESSAVAINADGFIAGRATFADGTGRAAYYTTSWFDLGTLGGTTSRAVAINDAGQVAGIADLAGDLDAHAFLWGGGQMTDLAGANGPSSVPSALNDAGQAVGWTFDPLTWASHDVSPAPLRAFIHSGGAFAELGTLSGGTSQARDISNAGLLVGRSDGRAFVSAGGTLRDLGTLGGPTSSATAINGRGVIVGSADTASGLRHATAWLPVPTSTLALAPATGPGGGTTVLVATLSAFGLPIPNATITFSLNGVAVGSGITSASGAATLPDVSLAGLSPGSYPGVVQADYAANSALGGSSASGDLTVIPPPVASDDAYTTAEDTPLSVAAPGVLANDSNVTGGTAVLISGPAHGTLTFRSDGSFDYTPNANFFGTDSFTYKATVAGANSNLATVTLTVTPVDDPPVAADDSYLVGPGDLTVPAPGVLGNDADVDGDPLTAVLVTGPAHGTLSLAPDGSFTYSPAPGGPVIDTFTYRAVGAGVGSNVATVYLLADAVSPVLGGLVSSPRVTVNNGPGDQDDPHVDGDLMTYTDTQGQGSTSRIRYYSFSTGVDQGIPAGEGENDVVSAVNGGRVTFSRARFGGGMRIMFFDTRTPNAAPTEIDPTPGFIDRVNGGIGGGTIAFTDVSSGYGHTKVWDLASARAGYVPPSPLSDWQYAQVSPDGRAIVWARCGQQDTDCEVVKARGALGTFVPYTAVRQSASGHQDPHTDGTWIVYQIDQTNPLERSIYLTPLTGTPLTGGQSVRLALLGYQSAPRISHGVISFAGSQSYGGNHDVYVYVIATNTLYQVTDTPTVNDILSDVSVLPNGDIRVVWAANDELIPTDHNVYATTFTPGAISPLPVAVASGSAAICPGSSTLLSGSGGASCSWSPGTGLDNAASCTPVASPAATTTYTLTVTDSQGRSSTNNPTVTVTVNTPPTAVASGSATINAGQSTPLSGSGGVSCSWSPAAGLDNAGSCTPIASPAVTTTYTLTVASAGGCVSSNAPGDRDGGAAQAKAHRHQDRCRDRHRDEPARRHQLRSKLFGSVRRRHGRHAHGHSQHELRLRRLDGRPRLCRRRRHDDRRQDVHGGLQPAAGPGDLGTGRAGRGRRQHDDQRQRHDAQRRGGGRACLPGCLDHEVLPVPGQHPRCVRHAARQPHCPSARSRGDRLGLDRRDDPGRCLRRVLPDRDGRRRRRRPRGQRGQQHPHTEHPGRSGPPCLRADRARQGRCGRRHPGGRHHIERGRRLRRGPLQDRLLPLVRHDSRRGRRAPGQPAGRPARRWSERGRDDVAHSPVRARAGNLVRHREGGLRRWAGRDQRDQQYEVEGDRHRSARSPGIDPGRAGIGCGGRLHHRNGHGEEQREWSGGNVNDALLPVHGHDGRTGRRPAGQSERERPGLGPDEPGHHHRRRPERHGAGQLLPDRRGRRGRPDCRDGRDQQQPRRGAEGKLTAPAKSSQARRQFERHAG